MGKILFVLLSFFIFTQAYSQNLVPNPSFEEVNDTTYRWSGTHFMFNKLMKYWESPTQGSPDILFEENLLIMHPPRPGVSLKGNHARTGNFMAGLKVFGCALNTHHCKEYLQIKLDRALVKGEKYAYEYWVNPIKGSVKVNSFGVALSENQIQEDMIIGLLDIPSVTMNTEIVNTAPSNWYRISGTIVATDDSGYLLIGNFLDDSMVSNQPEEDGIKYAYYLIDDVSLVHIPQEESIEIEPGQTIVFYNLLFDFDKTTLLSESEPELFNILEALQRNPELQIEVTGHTDNVGSDSYNLDLSLKRAGSIRAYLIRKGIDESRLKAIGLGSSKPLMNNETEENRRINRRVEIRVLGR